MGECSFSRIKNTDLKYQENVWFECQKYFMKAEMHTGMGCVARRHKYTSLEILNIRQSGWTWMAEGEALKEVEGRGNSWSSFTARVMLRVKHSSLSKEWYFKKTYLIPHFWIFWFVGHILCFWMMTFMEPLSRIHGEPSLTVPRCCQ